MSIYEIKNIGPTYRVTVSSSTLGLNRFALSPGQSMYILQVELANWPQKAKNDLADYVQNGTLQVDARTTVHVVQDKANMLTVTDANNAPATGLYTAVLASIAFKQAFNRHIGMEQFHLVSDTTNPITSADPDTTDPEATQLADMITLLTEAQTNFDAHIADTTYHVFADTHTTSAAVPTDIASCIVALNELYALFNAHLLWFQDDTGVGTLTSLDIISL